ncbi:MAG: Rho termination factor N-terminal domain-containing protein [Candidatus Izemoplasmataceae bacterium]
MDKDALEEKTVDELKELCKEQGITGYSKLKKDELIDVLTK